jgi:very-short-patch-repair endonuclease
MGRGSAVSEPERLNYKHYQKAAREAKNKHLEVKLEKQLADRGITDYLREHRFHPERKWRFDFYFPEAKVAVEVDGGIYGAKPGRHNRGVGMEADNEKLNAAVSMGIVVLRFGPEALKKDEAAPVIEKALHYWSSEDGRATC